METQILFMYISESKAGGTCPLPQQGISTQSRGIFPGGGIGEEFHLIISLKINEHLVLFQTVELPLRWNFPQIYVRMLKIYNMFFPCIV